MARRMSSTISQQSDPLHGDGCNVGRPVEFYAAFEWSANNAGTILDGAFPEDHVSLNGTGRAGLWPISNQPLADQTNRIESYSDNHRPLFLHSPMSPEQMFAINDYATAPSAISAVPTITDFSPVSDSVAPQFLASAAHSSQSIVSSERCKGVGPCTDVPLDVMGMELLQQDVVASNAEAGPAYLQCWQHGCRGRSFTSFSNYRRHLKEKEGKTKKAICSRCGQQFARASGRNVHYAGRKCKVIQFDANGVPSRTRIR